MLSPEAKELSKEILVVKMEIEKAKDQVVRSARQLPAVLRDHGLPSLASDIEYRIFMLDAQEERMMEMSKRPGRWNPSSRLFERVWHESH